ncbi:MAG: arginine--tRNA ligase [Ignavibacteriae bacterium]|nr:MAG: arginine--tRNA ligase [Ignavibacteriota bacterium]
MKNYLNKIFDEAKNKLNYLNDIELQFSIPQESSHGDYSINAAMMLSKKLKKNPREIANEIIENLKYDSKIISKIDIAGPGFINFYFTHTFVNKFLETVISKGSSFGHFDKFKDKTANVEFVSANPTGPLTVGHGRNAVLGDVISNLLEAIGYSVDREYYFNNAGRQMRVLGKSIALRYLELFGVNEEFPEECYQGEYIKDIAKKVKAEFGNKFQDDIENNIFKETAEREIFNNIKKTLGDLKINFATYFNEDNLYKNKDIDEVLKKFEEKNLSYKSEGATWLKFSELGQGQDKVIIKSTGEPTYRLPDIAYHESKFKRGYDLIVDIFGSDHNATYPDVLAGTKSLGYDIEKVKVVIYQFVTIIENGEVVKMSTRKANFITLDELIDEVGADVVRYFFIMRNHSSHMNFDLGLAKKHSDENPIFYLKYAHARICSILKLTKEEKLNSSLENLNLLNTEIEQKLIKHLHCFEDEVYQSAVNLEPHKIANYLETLAALFHKFYTECRIIGSEVKLAEARIALIESVKIVLKNGLNLLSIEPPEKM